MAAIPQIVFNVEITSAEPSDDSIPVNAIYIEARTDGGPPIGLCKKCAVNLLNSGKWSLVPRVE